MRLTIHSFSISGLADLDDLHAEQLDLGAAVLQHLLCCTQQFTVLRARGQRSRTLGGGGHRSDHSLHTMNFAVTSTPSGYI